VRFDLGSWPQQLHVLVDAFNVGDTLGAISIARASRCQRIVLFADSFAMLITGALYITARCGRFGSGKLGISVTAFPYALGRQGSTEMMTAFIEVTIICGDKREEREDV